MVKRDLIRNIIIAVLAIVVISLLRVFVLSTHRVTEGQANDYIHAGDYVTFNKNVEPQKKDFIHDFNDNNLPSWFMYPGSSFGSGGNEGNIYI